MLEIQVTNGRLRTNIKQKVTNIPQTFFSLHCQRRCCFDNEKKSKQILRRYSKKIQGIFLGLHPQRRRRIGNCYKRKTKKNIKHFFFKEISQITNKYSMNILGPAPSEVKHDRQLLQMEEQQISLCLRSARPNTFMFIFINICILDFAFLQCSVYSFVFVFSYICICIFIYL